MKLRDLKSRGHILAFLQENNIKTISDIQNKISELHRENIQLSSRIKPVERRIKTLELHLENANKYLDNKEIFVKYKGLKPGKQNDFYNKYATEIIICKAAKNYLNSIMNDKTTLPIKEWEKELAGLKRERVNLYNQYNKLKGEIKDVEDIKKVIDTEINIKESFKSYER